MKSTETFKSSKLLVGRFHQEGFDRLKDELIRQIYEHKPDLTLAEALGVLRLVEHDIILESGGL